jgi:hypothetical protein
MVSCLVVLGALSLFVIAIQFSCLFEHMKPKFGVDANTATTKPGLGNPGAGETA